MNNTEIVLILKKGLRQATTEGLERLANWNGPMLLDGKIYDYYTGCG